MQKEIYVKSNNEKNSEKYLYFSAVERDFFRIKGKNLFKNYVLDPDVRLIN